MTRKYKVSLQMISWNREAKSDEDLDVKIDYFRDVFISDDRKETKRVFDEALSTLTKGE